jgi:hypothetical protein
MADTVKRKDLDRRLGELKNERESWMHHWQEISRYILPRSGRYFLTDRNKGQRRHNNILDRTGSGALNALASGMMSGMTSPARPWLRFATPDKDLMKSVAVKVWLADVADIILTIFARGNTYRALHQIYKELGAFGTAASVLLDDFHDVQRNYTLTAGEFCIAQDWRGETCTLYREFEKTVGEIVKEFGLSNCSSTVQAMFNCGTLDAWVPLVQAIEPREDRDQTKRDSINMPWRSIYYERGSNNDKFLRESGFKEFPALAPRWDVSGGDIYGNSPAMEALGDVKQLQQEQFRKSQGIDYMTKPPIALPAGMKNREVDGLPGGTTYFDGPMPSRSSNLFDVNLNLNDLMLDIQDVRGRINSAFFADLFLMISNNSDPNMTATEVAARQEEKMLMLGPVIERMTDELLNPLVQGCFHRALAAGMLPPPPPELHGAQIDIEYVSVLAQAQRAIGVNSIDRFVGNLGQIAAFKPGVLDKFDSDTWADRYSDLLGVPPDLIVADDKVALLRKARAQQASQAQGAAQANQNADTAQKLANTPMNDNTALASLVSRGGLVQTSHPGGPLAGSTGYN